MKLIIAVVHDEDVLSLMKKLSSKGFMSTKLSSTGGFLKAGNTTLIIGVEDSKVKEVKEIFEEQCKVRKKFVGGETPYTNIDGFTRKPIEVNVGGATVFVVDVCEFFKI